MNMKVSNFKSSKLVLNPADQIFLNELLETIKDNDQKKIPRENMETFEILKNMKIKNDFQNDDSDSYTKKNMEDAL